MEQLTKDLLRKLRKTPDKTQFGITFTAGHGMIKDGLQNILLNEFDKLSEFYKLYPIEAKVRMITSMAKNGYLIVIVACCRENFK